MTVHDVKIELTDIKLDYFDPKWFKRNNDQITFKELQLQHIMQIAQKILFHKPWQSLTKPYNTKV